MHTYYNHQNFCGSIMKITKSPITSSFKDSHDKYFVWIFKLLFQCIFYTYIDNFNEISIL